MDFKRINMYKTRKTLCVLIVASVLNSLVACTFLPGVQETQPYISGECELVTRQLDLDAYLGTEEASFSKNVQAKEELELSSEDEETVEKESRTKNSFSSSSSRFGNGDSGLYLLAIIAVWAGATLIVSGSIVVVGNMLHWSEYQGRCDESEIW
jgi:hypothetical protein